MLDVFLAALIAIGGSDDPTPYTVDKYDTTFVYQGDNSWTTTPTVPVAEELPTPPALVETGVGYRVSILLLLVALILLISGAVAIVVREVRDKR